MILAIVVLLVGLLLLGYGANHLINGSIRVANYLKVPALLIGLTIVAIGTSAPELFLSAMAAVNGNGALSVGNIIGSNIFNLGFILGLSAIVAPILIQKKLVYRDGFFLILITGLIFAMLRNQHVDWREGVILLALLVGYNVFLRVKKDVATEDVGTTLPKAKNFIYLFAIVGILSMFTAKGVDGNFGVGLHASMEGMIFLGVLMLLFAIVFFKKEIPALHSGSKGILLTLIKIIASLGVLVLASHHVVNASVFLAQMRGVSEWAIGATIVAAGTSLPEIAATIAAILKKRYDIGVGNVIGSDVFNILGIIGISSIIAPLTLESNCLFVADCTSSRATMLLRDNIFSVGVLILTLIITFIFMRTRRKISKREGIVLFSFALIRMAFEIDPNLFAQRFGG